MAQKPYRVVIADDHPVVRRGIRTMLQSQPGIEVCEEASNGIEALNLIRQLKPDLLVLDLTMPEMDGLSVVSKARQESPSTDILVLTMHFSEELAREVLKYGALGYVLKSDADTDLLVAVDHIRNHEPYFTSQLSVSMAQNFIRDPSRTSEGPLPGTSLTAREVEVVQLLAAGKSNKEAASQLRVSTRTIESHRNHIMRKMNFASFSDMVRFAIRNKIVDL